MWINKNLVHQVGDQTKVTHGGVDLQRVSDVSAKRNARSSGLHCLTHKMAEMIWKLLSAGQFRILRLPIKKRKDKSLQKSYTCSYVRERKLCILIRGWTQIREIENQERVTWFWTTLHTYGVSKFDSSSILRRCNQGESGAWARTTHRPEFIYLIAVRSVWEIITY